jgi:hypothetical protein
MLAEEYKLIDILLSAVRAERINSTAYHNFNFSNSIGLLYRLKEHTISAQQKALYVICNSKDAS